MSHNESKGVSSDVCAKKREIAARYDYDRKTKNRRAGWWRTRIGALTKVFGGRYGGGKLFQLPDDDAGRDDLRILLDHYAYSNPSAMPRVMRARAPWLSDSERESLERVGRSPRYWSSTELAAALNLTEAERVGLGRVPTIGAVDVTPKARQAKRRDEDRERKRKKRRAAGMKLQADSISRAKPWLAEKKSRAAWYRQRRETTLSAEQESPETVLSAVNLINPADETVSPSVSNQTSGSG